MTFNIDLGSLIISSLGFGIAVVQLNKIQRQLEISIDNQKKDSLKIVLEIETQMNSRKLEFDKASKQIREAELDNIPDEKMEIFGDYFEATKENYFNALDRLCYCIDKRYIDDKDWRTEYRNLLHTTIKYYPDDFNEASPYKNIKKINREWQKS